MSHVPTAQPDRCPIQGELVNDAREQAQDWKLFREKHNRHSLGGKEAAEGSSSQRCVPTSQRRKGQLPVQRSTWRVTSTWTYTEGLRNQHGHAAHVQAHRASGMEMSSPQGQGPVLSLHRTQMTRVSLSLGSEVKKRPALGHTFTWFLLSQHVLQGSPRAQLLLLAYRWHQLAPISSFRSWKLYLALGASSGFQIGRASCRERV